MQADVSRKSYKQCPAFNCNRIRHQCAHFWEISLACTKSSQSMSMGNTKKTVHFSATMRTMGRIRSAQNCIKIFFHPSEKPTSSQCHVITLFA